MDSKLPYKKSIIKHFDFAKKKMAPNLMGTMSFNEDKNKYEIEVDKGLSLELRKLTEIHELVHARRKHGAYVAPKEENEVEAEAIARTPKTCLTQGEGILHDYLIHNPKKPDKPLSPNDENDLKIILKRIKKIVVK